MNIQIIEATKLGRKGLFSEDDVKEIIEALEQCEEGQAVAFGDDVDTEATARGRSNSMRRFITAQEGPRTAATVVKNDDGTFRPAVRMW